MKGKRLLSIFLTLLLVLTSFSSVFAAPDKVLRGTKTFNTQNFIKGSRLELDPRVKSLRDNSQIRIIVELSQEPVVKYASNDNVKVSDLTSTTREKITDELLKIQKEVKNDIADNNINIKYHHSFVNIFNGFSGTTTLSEAKKIEKLTNVKSVYIANEYQRPEPDMNTSLDIVNARETWSELGYDGEGMVVAIVDTGIDPSHKDMVLTNANKAQLDRHITDALVSTNSLPGKWYTEKVPYGYNYMDNNDEILDLGPDASMHGMHVAGTVGANGNPNNNGIKGVAPESQLLAMKVFGNDPGMPSTFGDVIIRAIDDSVALGADVINMSLGSTSAFVMPDDPEQQAVTRAVDNGVFVSISAGNSNHIGDGYNNPLAQNPDIGVVGSPGLTAESMQVASIENTNVKANALEYIGADEESCLIGYVPAGSYDPVDVFNSPVEFVNCGLGGVSATYEAEGLDPQDDFAGVDLDGKIALIERGKFAFVDKIMNAQNNGAVGVIIFNHESGGNGLINMMYPEEGVIPAVFIGHSDGLDLLRLIDIQKNSIEFNGKQTTILNPNAGKMSDFTSWGTTPSLDFKPEVTAPGGQIYSTANNNKYQVMSGTSMAAPHVSGGAALVLQMVEDRFPNLTGKEKINMAKNIIMSTASPLPDKGLYNDYFGLGDYNFTSPRRHGAGVMDLYAATTTPAIVVDKNTELSKVNLKEIDNNTTFTLTANNFSNETVTYAVYGTVETDLAFDGVNQLETQGVYDINTIAPDGPNGFWSGEYPITFTSENGTVIDNVYNYIEVPAGESVDFNVSIDLSNAADWNYNAPLQFIFPNGTFIEGFVRLTDVNDNTPELSIPYIGFYGDWDKVPVIDESVYSDGLSYYEITCMVDGEGYFLGQLPNEEFDESKIAFSPNNDGWFDSANAVLSFLRNAKEVDVNVLDADGNKLRDLYNEEYVRKNYFDGGIGTFYNWKPEYKWDGTVNNKTVPDGEYIYEVKTKIDYAGADWQSVEFPVVVDTVNPEIQSVDYSNENNTITVTASDSGSTIREYYLIENNQIVMASTDGVFDISTLKDVHRLMVVVDDYAGNETVYDEIIIIGDDTIPYVYMDSPEPFGIYNVNEIPVYGSIVDAAGLKDLRINGEDLPYSYNEETNRFDFATSLIYVDGKQKIDVTAVDILDHEINFERTVFVDTTAPTINMTKEPTDRIVDYTVEKVDISAEISDNLPDLLVKVNGNILTNIAEDWSYFDDLAGAEYTFVDYEVNLEYGDNLITVEADDSAGNKTIKEYKVYRKQEGEEDPIFDIVPEIIELTVTPVENVSNSRPVTISAIANQELDWEVKVINPNDEIEATFTETGAEFETSWAPEEFKKLNGDYKVNLSVTNGIETVVEETTFNVYNYPVNINNVNVIKGEGYVSVEAAMENLGPNAESPMLLIQVTDEAGCVINISTAKMLGLQPGQVVQLSSGFGLTQTGTYNVDVYVWTGWDSTESLANPQEATFVIE